MFLVNFTPIYFGDFAENFWHFSGDGVKKLIGFRPDYAVNSSDESDEDGFNSKNAEEVAAVGATGAILTSARMPLPRTSTEAADPRLKRLYQHIQHSSNSDPSR